VTRIGRWWSRIAGAPMRALARRLSRRLPHDSYDGVDMVLSDTKLGDCAEPFFANTREALRYASRHAPRSYARFRRDVRAVVLMDNGPAEAYQRFQLAVLVPQSVALADVQAYAAWLLHASGLSEGAREARARASELLGTLDPQQREDVISRLPPRQKGRKRRLDLGE
jgi:hypothetical protein